MRNLKKRKRIVPLFYRSKAMFPNLGYKEDEYLSQQYFCKLKATVER